MVNRMAKMDLKLAYNKVDNLCCLNHNTFQIINEHFKQLFKEGKITEQIEVDFFEGYKYNQDEDFCKDINEMIDALETIKEVVDLQEKLGCSLVSFIKIISLPYNSKNQIYDEFGNVWIVDKLQYTYNNLCLFEVKTHIEVLGEIKYNYFRINEYKKNWWLKEDKSE